MSKEFFLDAVSKLRSGEGDSDYYRSIGLLRTLDLPGWGRHKRVEYVEDPLTGCFVVVSHAFANGGYPVVHVNGTLTHLHRAVYFLLNNLSLDKSLRHLVVLHSCGNRSCVNPRHLRLGSVIENNRDSAKLTYDDVVEIREALRSGEVTQKALALKYGVCVSNISRIATGRSWR